MIPFNNPYPKSQLEFKMPYHPVYNTRTYFVNQDPFGFYADRRKIESQNLLNMLKAPTMGSFFNQGTDFELEPLEPLKPLEPPELKWEKNPMSLGTANWASNKIKSPKKKKPCKFVYIQKIKV